MQPRLVLDASVLIEYITTSSYRQLMKGIFGGAVRERKLFINSVTLSEALYIAMRHV